MMYKVVEKFISINGEGRRMGELATFIRFAHCNLNCAYCDTQWANEEQVEYKWMTREDILDYLIENKVKNVTLTGGEPLIQEGMGGLLVHLNAHKDLNIEIETNGSVDITPFKNLGLDNVSFTVDFKLPLSGMVDKMDANSFKAVDQKDTVKFVITNGSELPKVKEVIDAFDLEIKTQVFLSPVFGVMNPEEVIEFMKAHQLNQVKLQIQMHKVIWDPEERGV